MKLQKYTIYHDVLEYIFYIPIWDLKFLRFNWITNYPHIFTQHYKIFTKLMAQQNLLYNHLKSSTAWTMSLMQYKPLHAIFIFYELNCNFLGNNFQKSANKLPELELKLLLL